MNPKDRPDYEYWKADRKGRNQFDIEKLTEELRVYSEDRFPLGRRFLLTRAYAGTPARTGCTVTRLWPDTRVRWDKWGKGKHGGRECTMSYDLDILLEPEDE